MPYVGFYRHQNSNSPAVARGLGGDVYPGQPYMRTGQDENGDDIYESLAGAAWVVLAEYCYWQKREWIDAVGDQRGKFVVLDASEEPQRSAKGLRGKEKWNESYEVVLLFLPGTDELPEDVPTEPLHLSFSGTKADAIREHLNSVDYAMTPGFAKRFGAVAGSLQPRYRAVSSWRMDAKKNYAIAHADTDVPDEQQVEAITDWIDEGHPGMGPAMEHFGASVGKVQAFIAAKDPAED